VKQEKAMKTEIPDDVLEAIVAVVYWSRSADGDGDILSYDIPLLDRWVVELGLLPPANPPETEEEWAAFNAVKAAWEARHYGRREE
jgi:hypothetical protein